MGAATVQTAEEDAASVVVADQQLPLCTLLYDTLQQPVSRPKRSLLKANLQSQLSSPSHFHSKSEQQCNQQVPDCNGLIAVAKDCCYTRAGYVTRLFAAPHLLHYTLLKRCFCWPACLHLQHY